MFSQVFVCPQGGGGSAQPPRRQTWGRLTNPPPRGRPPPPHADPPLDTVNKRAVRILMECIRFVLFFVVCFLSNPTLGFKARVISLIYILCHLYAMDFSDSPLVQHLFTS